MADLGISIATKLIEVIGSEVIREICDIWGYKSELEDLNHTVSIIRNVLIEAESKRELSNKEKAYIEDLKAAVYDADDLFDEFFTLAELKQLRPLSKRGKLFDKVCRFFSSKNQVSQAYRMARQVRDIKKELDTIANNHKKFGFSVDYTPISRRREETCSYVDARVIIGRENDKEIVIDMLLGPNDSDEDFRVVTVVGVGGLGKTALAQLVINDTEVVKMFPDPKLRLWVCVSDQDGEHFDVKLILYKMLELVSDEKPDSSSTKELLQKQFQEQLKGKRYLLCLDDVWNEDSKRWLDLKQFLMLGGVGSRIIVTTRSQMTAKVIGDKHTYKLQGLSQENSWRLFEMTAFDKQHKHINHVELVEIGKRILGTCYNIPLAIIVVGSLLFGQNVNKWRSFEYNGLAEIRKGDNEVMSVLKLSYHNLDSSLKSCFSYCALFPKDTRLNREILISLWMAQGYIVPFDRGQSVEDAAEEHFLILLRRCFFQDVERDEYGYVDYVKIHDLMHDVAQEVGREEICVLNSTTDNLGDKTRHVYNCDDRSVDSMFKNKLKVRSFMLKPQRKFDLLRSMIYKELMLKIKTDWGITIRDNMITKIVDNWMCLRVLEFKDQSFQSLPDSIGTLVHLRFLKLKYCVELETLCDSITELHNLQTLILVKCIKLRELPKKFSKLVKLRHLDLSGCEKLTSMPSGMDKLTNMRVLPYFVVGMGTEKQCEGRLEDLKALTNINGNIHIRIGENYRKEVMNERGGGGYLKNTRHLMEVDIEYDSNYVEGLEDLLEELEPHSNIKGFILKRYKDTIIPRWGKAEDNLAIFFPLLVKIELYYCSNLEEIPVLSRLPYLKSLELREAFKLEYIENRSRGNSTTTSSSEQGEEFTTFFPSLESLKLGFLSSLKGWWRGEELVEVDDYKLIFPRLLTLGISRCPNLMSIPPCPCVEDLDLYQSNTSLQLKFNKRAIGISQYDDVPPLRRLKITDVNSFETILGICISEDDNNDVPWKSLSQTLRHLEFWGLENHQIMPILANGVQYLTSLQTLQFICCEQLEALPEWIGSLSSLQYLYINHCIALKSLPESLQNLTALQKLVIDWCSPDLEERCKPDGEDWPYIQHIPHISIR